MYSFFNDYAEGTHPRILTALQETNLQQEPGYGLDSFSHEATALLRAAIDQPQASIHFVTTGTQANLVGLSSLLRPYESVIAADHGHICVHEAAAIEATGHKVHSLPSKDGKLDPASIEALLSTHNDDHSVQPRVVYISQATEFGTLYTKSELAALRAVCEQYQLYLYLDGARLGNAVVAPSTDLGLKEIAALVDMFYLGGAKNGALFGEAIIITNPLLQPHFRHHLKQRGALLAKARAVSVQFVELFKDGLFFENATHANTMALTLANGIEKCGYSLSYQPETNQLFPIFPISIIDALRQKYGFYIWDKTFSETHASIRLVTSWATPLTAIEAFLSDLQQSSVSEEKRKTN